MIVPVLVALALGWLLGFGTAVWLGAHYKRQQDRAHHDA